MSTQNNPPTLDTGVAFDDVVTGFPIPHNGTYEAIVAKAEMQDSAAGNKMVVVSLKPLGPVKCTVFEPGQAPKEIEVSDREVFQTWLTIKQGALANLKEFYSAIGKKWNSKDVNALKAEVESHIPTFTGQRVKVVAEREPIAKGPRQGEIACRVKHIVKV